MLGKWINWASISSTRAVALSWDSILGEMEKTGGAEHVRSEGIEQQKGDVKWGHDSPVRGCPEDHQCSRELEHKVVSLENV